MSRDEASLLDIFNAGKNIIQFAETLTREQLEIDIVIQSAIFYQAIVIGEATKRLTQNYRLEHSHIPWKRIAGLRDILTHQYDKVDIDIIWRVIQQEIPSLLEKIAPLIPIEPLT
jgi:uncharacterized protein with HEPN domain